MGGHSPGVPSLSAEAPSMERKPLSRRVAWAEAIVHTQRVTVPSKLIVQARAEAFALHERVRAEIPTGEPAAVASLVKAAVALRSQLLDLLSLPTRPRGESRRRLLTLPPSDVSTVEPLPPDPRTIPGVPPIDA